MSRSGYSDSCDGWELNLWRGAVESALRGKRGQSFLKEMLAALDSLPEKKLIANELKSDEGNVCALGSVGAARGVDMSKVDVESREDVAKFFGISEAMAAEIQFVNDDEFPGKAETPEQRFARVRQWIVEEIKSL